MNTVLKRGRPPRLDRLFDSVEPFFFVTICTINRWSILADDSVHRMFREYAFRGLNEQGIAVGRYVIMPDHLHVFVRLPPGVSLASWGRLLKQTITKRCFHGSIWQRGFFDHVMRSADSYSLKWDYVRQNPVRAGLVSHPEEWPFQGEIVALRF